MAPLLPVAIAFIIGILFRGAVHEVWWAGMLLVPAITALCLRRTYPAMLALCAVAGFLVCEARTSRPLPDSLTSQRMRWSGVVKEHREYSGAQMLIVRVDSCAGAPCASFPAKCLVPSLIPAVDETDRITFSSVMHPLSLDRDLPDQQVYNSTLHRMGVVAEAVIEPDSILSVRPEGGVLNSVRRMRHDLQRLIACAPVGESTRSFLLAALTGDRTWLSADTRELFSLTGIAHILALSGLHVGVLTMILSAMFVPYMMSGGSRYVKTFAVVGALWVFAVMTGLSPSVVRAVIMATMAGIGVMLQRTRSPLNSLSAAALVILLFAPLQVYSLGFMLSFLAVLSIILFADRLNPVGYRRPALRILVGYITVSLAAVLGTGMVCAWSFHILPVYFLITNLAVSLLLPPLLGSGVLLLALNALGLRALWLGSAVDWLMALVEGVAGWVAALPGAAVTGLWVPLWAVAVYFVVLALFGLWLYRRRAVLLYAMSVVLLFATVYAVAGGQPAAAHEAYITRSTTETSMLVRDADRIYIYTTAPRGRTDEVREGAERRYGGYMMRRGIHGLSLMHDGRLTDRTLREDNLVVACGKSFVFVSHGRHAHCYAVRPDYAVVCRGFRGDICRLAEAVGADTLLLSRDLDMRRHDRYVRELTAASIPHRSLRPAPFHITAD